MNTKIARLNTFIHSTVKIVKNQSNEKLSMDRLNEKFGRLNTFNYQITENLSNKKLHDLILEMNMTNLFTHSIVIDSLVGR